MKRDELEAVMQEYDGVFVDTGLLFHAYRAYVRDYELIVLVPGITEYRGIYSYVFRYCVEASTKTNLPPDLWNKSLDDRLTNYRTYATLWDQGIELDGFVWGVGAGLWPGWKLLKTSERAAWWTQELGMEFHEMLIETNAFDLRLVFSDLFVTHLSTEIPDAAIPGTEESRWWLERYWSAPAPSSPYYLASDSSTTPPSPNGTRIEKAEDGDDKVIEPRAPRLSTMSFHVLLDGEPIGLIEPVGADQSTGVVRGHFSPLPAYERVSDLFQQITLANHLSLPEVRDLALDYLHRARDALNLTIITAGGRRAPAKSLRVYDTADSGAHLDGYEAEFVVTTTEFFYDQRFWSGWQRE